MKVTEYIARTLKATGVDAIFGYQGSSIAHMIDSICGVPGLDFIECRNEQGAAFAANGYSQAGNRLGVAIACSGPGALNLISGIADAFYDSLPCLFICGQVSQKEMRNDTSLRQYGFQETDITSIVEPITKYATTIEEPEHIEEELVRAISLALTGRPGPTLLSVPHNIQGAQTASTPRGITIEETLDNASERLRATLREELSAATRPIIIMGGGCSKLSRKTMCEIDGLRIPIVTSYRGKACYDNTLDSYCGTWGVHGARAANWAVKYSDLAICLGTRLDGRQTAGEPLQVQDTQNVIVIDIDDSELDKLDKSYLTFKEDAICAAEALVTIGDACAQDGAWLTAIKSWMHRYPCAKEYLIEERINPNSFLERLSMSVTSPANYCVDVGQNQLWANASLCIGRDQHLIQSSGLGAMGFALPSAIGAFLENGKLTICISGDGGVQMNIQELQTIAEHRLPIKSFVLNNESLGLIRDYQTKALDSRTWGSVEGFSSPDYRLLAKAYDIAYLHIDDIDQLPTIAHALNDDRAWIIEVSISPSSTAKPEPIYGKSILFQADPLTSSEMKTIESEAYDAR